MEVENIDVDLNNFNPNLTLSNTYHKSDDQIPELYQLLKD